MDAPGLEAALKALSAMRARGLTLAVAESCTGGYITHLLTSHPGASMALKGAVTAYTADSKHRLLKIDRKVLGSVGTVSADCSRLMAEGALDALATDAALSTTGVLGPDPLEGKPPGVVFISVALRGHQTLTREFALAGCRQSIKQQAARAALEMLMDSLLG